MRLQDIDVTQRNLLAADIAKRVRLFSPTHPLPKWFWDSLGKYGSYNQIQPLWSFGEPATHCIIRLSYFPGPPKRLELQIEMNNEVVTRLMWQETDEQRDYLDE